ncbi:hypothetical protein PAQ31011_02420 [Pandoraea aquatica]|uniref:Uncharacterized protein n=1 Tax=Pandoraea aquatica TaxID=2508290 RepID=A0A5E4V3W9_9BURK|nr:hypothetical protein PAQ31011_02420 [Pandoraea aquatica]
MLLIAIPLTIVGMLFAILSPVIGIPLVPSQLRVSLVRSIIRIDGELLLVPPIASFSLAKRR